MTASTSNTGIVPSAVLATTLLLGSGAGYRMLAAHYARPSDSVPIPRGTLAELPLVIGSWHGVDQPLDAQIVRATDTDDLINRVYRRYHGETVALFIGYGVNLRDLAPHRPEVCYPGAGWTLVSTRRARLDVDDESDYPCQIHRFHRGGLVTERVVVLNYYIVDGKACPDVSLLRSRAWHRRGGPSYAAQVQVVCSAETPVHKVEELVQDFAAETAPMIRSLIVRAVDESLNAHGAGDDDA